MWIALNQLKNLGLGSQAFHKESLRPRWYHYKTMQIQATFVHKAELVQILPNACYEVNNTLTLEPQKPRTRQKIKTNQYLPWSQIPKPEPSIVKLKPRLWEVAHYSMCSGPSPGVHLKTQLIGLTETHVVTSPFAEKPSGIVNNLSREDSQQLSSSSSQTQTYKICLQERAVIATLKLKGEMLPPT